MQQQGEARPEIYTYESANLVYSCGWSVSWPPAVSHFDRLRRSPEEDWVLVWGLTVRSRPWCRGWGRRTPCPSSSRTAAHPAAAAAPAAPAVPDAACLQVRPDKPFRLALGSFIEDYANRVEIVQREHAAQRQPAPASAPASTHRCRDFPQRSTQPVACGCLLPTPPTSALTLPLPLAVVQWMSSGAWCAATPRCPSSTPTHPPRSPSFLTRCARRLSLCCQPACVPQPCLPFLMSSCYWKLLGGSRSHW